MNDFFSQLNTLQTSTSLDEDTVYSFIHNGLSDLLVRDVQLLFQLLYRIDVKENLVKEIFNRSEQSEDIVHQLTLLIIERLKQKAEIRRRYTSE